MAISGAASSIQTDILKHFNDKGAAYLGDAEMINTLNEVHRLVAHERVFRTTETFDAVSDTYIYDLSSELTDETYLSLLDLTWEGNTYSERMWPIANPYQFKAKRRALQGTLTTGQPCIYTVDGTNVKVWPAPSSNATDAFEADYAYMPDDIEDDVSYTFPSLITKAWYPLYVYGGLWISYDKAAPSQKSKALSGKYQAMFQEQIRKLRGSTYLGGSITVRPG
jgi:hypothetical protein